MKDGMNEIDEEVMLAKIVYNRRARMYECEYKDTDIYTDKIGRLLKIFQWIHYQYVSLIHSYNTGTVMYYTEKSQLSQSYYGEEVLFKWYWTCLGIFVVIFNNTSQLRNIQ